MLNTIYYNNIDIVSGIGTISAIGKDVAPIYYGERWAQKHVISLVGLLTGQCYSGFSGIVDRQNQLVSRFSKGFQNLEVYENSQLIDRYSFVRVANISFPQNRYLQLLPFQIDLEVYPQDYFSGAFGVLDPKEEVSFQEEDDGILTINHIVSARGIQTSNSNSNSLDNAKAWVQARSGWAGTILPAFATGVNFSPCLQQIQENIDPFNSTYEIKESYTTDIYQSGYGILRFTTEFNSGIEDGISTLSLRGAINGCKNGSVSMLRTRYADFNALSEAVNQYRKITTFTDLNPIPVSKGVSEDTSSLNLSFSYLWNNSKAPITYFDYRVEFEYNYEEDIITASIDGSIVSRHPIAERWNVVKNFANNLDLYSIILPFYYEYVSIVAPHLSVFPLNIVPLSKRKSTNEFAASISLGATFDNSNVRPYGLRNFDYSVRVSPAIRRYNAAPLLDGQGEYVIFDLGYARRATCSINLQGVGDDNVTADQTEQILKNQAFKIQTQYLSGVRKHLQSQVVGKSNDNFNKNVTIQGVWSAESPIFNF